MLFVGEEFIQAFDTKLIVLFDSMIFALKRTIRMFLINAINFHFFRSIKYTIEKLTSMCIYLLDLRKPVSPKIAILEPISMYKCQLSFDR